MAESVIPRKRGDDYQARMFWRQACRLFWEHTAVERVGFEIDSPKSFDDVAVWYGRPIPDGRGGTFNSEFFQVKFHADHAGAITWEAFLDPSFIGAESVCLLERIRDACARLTNLNGGFRLNLVMPWGIDPADPLAKVIDGAAGLVRLRVLFDGTGPRGKMGRIRHEWRQKLGLSTDEELKQVLRPLVVVPYAGSLEMVRQQLNTELQLAGFSPVHDWAVGNGYDDLIHKLHAVGRNVFTRCELEEIAKAEGLWRGQAAWRANGKDIGIRSFMKWADRMEDETEAMLCLARHFDGRSILDGAMWKNAVLPELSEFLAKEISSGALVTLRMDTHGSIAFATGHHLDAKSGANVTVLQRSVAGIVRWPACAPAGAAGVHLWECHEIPRAEGSDVALAISVTHDIGGDVQHFVAANLPGVRRIVHLKVLPGTSPTAVRDGAHAASLAQEAVARVRSLRTVEERGGVLHVFAAAPNGLLFRIGQVSRSLGRLQLYEYDFDTAMPGAYRPSIALSCGEQACAGVAGVK